MNRWLRFFRRPLFTPAIRSATSRWPIYLGLIFGVWLSFVLYAGTLSLPFLQEDSTHIRWLSWHDPIEPFFSAEGAPAYRPLGKSIIKVWYLILGHHDRIWLRFHNIAFNALNIALIAALASWVDNSRHRYWTGGIAAILFGTFPFAYQAIPWINNFFYPLANFLLLAMTAVYWQARVRHSNRLLALALFLCFLAPFEIEYGLMASGLLFTVELIFWLQKRQPYPWLTGPLLGLALNLLFLVRSLTIPKQTYAFGPPTPSRLLLISTYFLQGLMYPISPAAIWLMELTGMGDVAAIWLVSLPVLLLMIALLLRQRQGALLAFSLLWFALLNLPALVFVDFDYVVNSPRLLYPPGVGIVILWGGFLAVLAGERERSTFRLVFTGFLLLLILASSITFVRERNFYYRLAERPLLQLAEIARQAPVKEELLVVNFPSWLSPRERTFAMGNHGVQIIPFYINIQELIYAHNEIDHPARAIQFANIRQEQPYYYGMLGEHVAYEKLADYLAQSGDVYLTDWEADQVELLHAGRVSGTPFESGEFSFNFDDTVQLKLDDNTLQDNKLTLNLQWLLHQKVDDDLTVFVHLYGPDGQLINQADGYPLSGMSPFWLWPAGQTLLDQRILDLPDESPPGVYQVGVGLYNPVNGNRLPVYDATGTAQPNSVARVLTINYDEE